MKKASLFIAVMAVFALVGAAQTSKTDTAHHVTTSHKSVHHSVSHLRKIDSAKTPGTMPNKP